MNRLDWEDAVRRLQKNVDPNHQSDVNNSMGHTSRTNNLWENFRNYQMYTVNEPHVSMRVNVGWERLGPPSHDFQNKQSTVEDPDGEPLEMDDEDPELARKRKELREIEEQIMQKKVALALKQVEPFVKTTTLGVSCNEQSATRKGESLRDRVNVILQQRHCLSFLSKVQSPNERTKSSNLNKYSLLREDHPLKLRVKALMKKRCSDSCILPRTTEVSNVSMPSTSQSISSPAEEENSADKGFQRFLSVLNKGVDMDLLSRIVNDNSQDLPLGEELLNIQLPTVENKSNPLLRSESHTSGAERKSEPSNRERSHNEGLTLPDGEKKNDTGESSFGSSSQSKSPPAVKNKKDEKEKTNLDEQSQQLQNILKTLGLNLDVEEMSKLADRTQERLYGKKCEARHRDDCSGEQESRQRASHRHYRNSSSSSSSSRSTTRSFSLSPSRRRRSHSRDSKERRASERSRSRDGSRDRLKNQDSNQDSKEPQTPRDRDQKISAYQHPPDLTYPHPQPAAFSFFPDHTLSQHSQSSQSTTLPSQTYSTATNSYWTYTQDAIPAYFYPHGFPNPQNSYHHFPGPPNRVYPDQNFEDIDMLMNPDLSTSEGQTGLVSGPRCLQVISTKRSAPQSQSQRTPCLKYLTKTRKRIRKGEAYARKCRLFIERRKQQRLRKRQNMAAKCEQPLQSVDVSQPGEAEQSEDSKQPTEEEIKANLRKKLEAFNQKVKKQVAQPANSQMLKSVESEDCL